LIKKRGLLGAGFWRLGHPRTWGQYLVRAFVLCHPMAEGRRAQEDKSKRL
jgi:hypothetical protein